MKVDRTNGLLKVSNDPGGESQLSVFANEDGEILLSVEAHGQDEIFILNDTTKAMSFRLGVDFSERFGIDVAHEADALIGEYYKQADIDYVQVIAYVDNVNHEFKVVVEDDEPSLAKDAEDCRGLAEFTCEELNSTNYILHTVSRVRV